MKAQKFLKLFLEQELLEQEYSDDEMKKFISDFEKEKKATELEKKGENPPSWVAEEPKWDKAKKASKDSYDEIRWPFVTWFYLNVLKGKTKK